MIRFNPIYHHFGTEQTHSLPRGTVFKALAWQSDEASSSFTQKKTKKSTLITLSTVCSRSRALQALAHGQGSGTTRGQRPLDSKSCCMACLLPGSDFFLNGVRYGPRFIHMYTDTHVYTHTRGRHEPARAACTCTLLRSLPPQVLTAAPRPGHHARPGRPRPAPPPRPPPHPARAWQAAPDLCPRALPQVTRGWVCIPGGPTRGAVTLHGCYFPTSTVNPPLPSRLGGHDRTWGGVPSGTGVEEPIPVPE